MSGSAEELVDGMVLPWFTHFLEVSLAEKPLYLSLVIWLHLAAHRIHHPHVFTMKWYII